MIYTLKNDILTVEISTRAAEIMSVKRGDCEYMWQGNPEFWASRAPVLFPICGRFFTTQYTYKGKTYDMGTHGFARLSEFDVQSVSDTSIVLTLAANDETRACYPFEFLLTVSYTLEGDKVSSTATIKNTGKETLPATFGAHPGFNVPLDGGSFEDYYIEFGEDCTPNELVFSDTCFNTGIKRAYPLENSRKLPLRHSLFNIDAIFMDRIADSATLKSDKSERFVTMRYAGMPYLGLWHKPQTQAPYVCIEPWCGLPSYDGKVDDLATKNDLFRIEEGKQQSVSYEIIFG